MPEPFELTVVEAADLMGRGRLSAVELMESLLARSRALDPGLRVWETLDEEAALAEAGRTQAELDRAGSPGALHGVPLGVKDIFYTAGLRTASGSPIYADFVPAYDAAPVLALKGAGAIVMGKTVTTEFACMDPSPTRNPWNPEHTPGGSSSGSAAGVAARMFPAALGSQTAGSVLRPAAYNGVVGLKPTFALVGRHGVTPVSWSLDTVGTFTRTVGDAALLLDALTGRDAYSAAVNDGTSPPRVGVVKQLFHDRASPEVRDHMAAVVERLSLAGARVREIGLRVDFDSALAAHRVVMSVQAASVHERTFAERAGDYGPRVRGLIEEGMRVTPGDYVRALRVQRAFRDDAEAAVAGFDVLVTPCTPSAAPRGLDTTGDPTFQTPWTFGGLPAISLPSGLDGSGLPLGTQLVSAPFADERLLSAAAWCEQVLDARLNAPV